MNKKEVKEASNAEMIIWLMHTQKTYQVTKREKKTAKYICQELEKRGVIEDHQSIYEEWMK